MAVRLLVRKSDALLASGFCAAYVLLDYVSFIHAYAPFGITPWNPPPGLSLSLILLGGPRFAPALVLAPLLADILVRQSPAPFVVEIASAAIVGGSYSLAATALLRWLRIDPALGALRDLFLLLAVAGAAALVVATGYVGLLAGTGLVPWDDFARAAGKMWIGDMIGIAVATPFITVAVAQQARPRPTVEGTLQVAAAAAALWVVFALDVANEFHLFWILFLPLIWTAARDGLPGVTRLLVVIQVGLVVALQLSKQDAAAVNAFQLLMLAMSVTTLALGCLVSAQRRAADRLREQQEALARLVRLSTMGETAAVMAHELNQPITALSNYARACLQTMRRDPADLAAAREIAEKLVVQVDRAIDVVARTRDFIRQGAIDRRPVRLQQVVEDSVALLQPESVRRGVAVRSSIAADVPAVLADPLHLQQVMLNLLRNSVEAIDETRATPGLVEITATLAPEGMVEIAVRDTGPGFPAEQEGRIVPFLSSKPHGTGLGLSICRSIVEAHGGRLRIESGRGGAVVRFTLPEATQDDSRGEQP
ncbi:MAG: MASE1 domain-containing protein [Alphaproteobacteria bacterium]|nr:MASE1 domain-containing protein [Alphaproteobacteria bacterium]